MEQSDAILVRRWQNGDVRSAAVIVERYTDVLGAVAFAILHDVSLAEDAVQETFTRATIAIRKLNDPARLKAWLIGITRHVALDIVRKRDRERPLHGHKAPAFSGNTGRHADRAELQASLQSAVAALPDDQRDLFAMKYVAGMTYQEIGQALEMTPEAVGQKLWRIRQKLQEELKDFRP